LVGELYNLLAYRSLPVDLTPGRLLDIGCGAGDYLRDMQELGWEVTGIDVSPKAVAKACERGFNAHTGSISSLEADEGCFELVTKWHVLEHLYDPVDALRHARRLLAPGGRLMLAAHISSRSA
jgi:2-polyprenyl-3-methyl-5-hydroxy-6-metoxy-1,4-benzoquinol methylase